MDAFGFWFSVALFWISDGERVPVAVIQTEESVIRNRLKETVSPL
jgi:hypothetical protein